MSSTDAISLAIPHQGIRTDSNVSEEEQNIELKSVELSYGRGTRTEAVLQDINLTINQGEFIVVLGPSGCGKTSLLNILAGYQRPTQGEVLIGKKKHISPTPEVGVVFQQANLFPWLNLSRNIEFGLRMKNVARQERRQRSDYLLEIMGLSEYADLYPHQLSGGMKQRAAIARTLAPEPDIILLDEPFSALDALTREHMQRHLREVWRLTGKSLFFITHDVDEALLLSSRIVVMHPKPGRIVENFINPLNEGRKAGRVFDDIREDSDFREFRQHLISRIDISS